MKQLPKKVAKVIASIVLVFTMILESLHVLSLIKQKADEKIPIPEAHSAYQFNATSQTLSVTNGVVGNFLDTRYSDTDYFRILTTSSGLDVTLTYDAVRLWNANRLIVMYDGLASAATLSYQIQIRDFANSTWRNILAHDGNYTNIAEAGAGLVLAPATTGAIGGGYIEIYDGYFSDGSNSPISTPLGNFVNSSGQVQLRLFSSTATANLELSVDLLMVQASNSPNYYASSMTNTAGGSITGEYNDTTTDDASSVVVNANASGIDSYFSFTNVSMPYSDANTFLVEVSSLRTTITNYSFYLRDFTNSQWDLLNSTALTATTDDTYYFSLVPSTLTQVMSDYISNNEIQLRVASASTSGTVTVDFAKVTIGSTATNSGVYLGAITQGTTSSGDVTNTRDVDTSQALSGWVINTEIDSTQADTIGGDCNTPATNNCVAANINLPVTLPESTLVQGVITAYRYNTSNAALDLTWNIRHYPTSYLDIMVAPTDQSNIATNIMYVKELSNPMRPQVGEGPLATIPTFTPGQYVDDINNAINLRFRTTTSDTTARSATVDFAFVTVKSLLPVNDTIHRWTATGGTLTWGSSSSSNFRFTKQDDASLWTVTPDGTNGIDAYLSFNGVEIPTGSNKMIITSVQAFSTASNSFEMFIYDFVAAAWREITPHETNFVSDGTASTQEYLQLEIYDGYFSNGINSPVSTPLTNFVSGGEVRLRIDKNATAGNLIWDFAQVQFVIDPSYHPAGMTLSAGLLTGGEYNDTTTDDGTYLTVAAVTSAVDFYLSFDNVVIPPEGFNALYIEDSAFKTGAGTVPFSLSLYNFTSSSWDSIGTCNTTTPTNCAADNTHYFIKEIGDWNNYISSGEMRIRYNQSGDMNGINVDFVQITLGMVPGSATAFGSFNGASMNGSVSSLANLDTVASNNDLDGSNYVTVTTANTTTGIRALDRMTGGEIEVDIPFHLNPGTVPAGLIWMYRGATGSTSIAAGISIEEQMGNFREISTATTTFERQFMATLTTLGAIPNSVDTSRLAISTQALRQGWYEDQLPDLWQSTDNRLRFRLYNVASSTNLELKLSIDTMFLSYRWVPTKTNAGLDGQLRHGKWWFGGEKQKDSF